MLRVHRYTAIALCVVLAGSVADASPFRRGGRHAAAVDESDDREIEDEERDVVDAPVKVRKRKRATTAPKDDWNFAIGPYVWLASVDANVSVGDSSVSHGIDFMTMKRHARFGAMAAGEIREGRFSLTGDLLYGEVGLDGAKEVGPLMVTVDAIATNVLVDGGAGYMVAGGDHSLLSLEARGGVRYQRTTISGSVFVDESYVAGTTQIQSGTDALAGARVFLRPARWFSLAGKADVGVVGSSKSTWSASVEANLRVGSHVLLSLGFKRLTLDRADIAITMHGPRFMVQLLL